MFVKNFSFNEINQLRESSCSENVESSTSLSGGNLVDGLLLASSNTGADLASWKPKNMNLFELMHSCYTRKALDHFPRKSTPKAAWGCNHLKIC